MIQYKSWHRILTRLKLLPNFSLFVQVDSVSFRQTFIIWPWRWSMPIPYFFMTSRSMISTITGIAAISTIRANMASGPSCLFIWCWLTGLGIPYSTCFTPWESISWIFAWSFFLVMIIVRILLFWFAFATKMLHLSKNVYYYISCP